MSFSKLKCSPIDRQTKEVIFNVFEFCSKEKSNMALTGEPCGSYCLVHPNKVYERVNLMTGVSERTVRNIMKEKEVGEFKSPMKSAPRTGVVQKIDDFDVCAIKRAIHSMYEKGERVTLNSILMKVTSELDLTFSRSSLRKILPQNLPGLPYF